MYFYRDRRAIVPMFCVGGGCLLRGYIASFCRPLRGLLFLVWNEPQVPQGLHLGLHSAAAPQLKIQDVRCEMLDRAQARASARAIHGTLNMCVSPLLTRGLAPRIAGPYLRVGY